MNISILFVFVLIMGLVQTVMIIVKGIERNGGFKEFFINTFQKPNDFQSYTFEQQVEWQCIQTSIILLGFYLSIISILLVISLVYV